MPSIEVEIARPRAACWRAFTDARSFAAWMPGLRRAVIVAERSDGLPLEVAFELSTSLTYSLAYTYDLEQFEVRWEPRVGARDAVRGTARLDEIEGGTRLTYTLEQGAARTTGDLVLGGAHAFLDAFVRWLTRRPATP